jgi:hypothetical protein
LNENNNNNKIFVLFKIIEAEHDYNINIGFVREQREAIRWTRAKNQKLNAFRSLQIENRKIRHRIFRSKTGLDNPWEVADQPDKFQIAKTSWKAMEIEENSDNSKIAERLGIEQTVLEYSYQELEQVNLL